MNKLFAIIGIAILSLSFSHLSSETNYNITIKKIKYQKDGFAFNVEFPQLENLENGYLELRLNKLFYEMVEKKIQELETWYNQEKEYKEDFASRVWADLNVSTKVFRQDNILSFRLDYYIYQDGAHGSDEFKVFNLNLDELAAYELEKVFDLEHDYNIELLKALVNNELIKGMETPCNMIVNNDIEQFKKFNLEQNHICFTINRITAHVCGVQEVRIPYSKLESIMRITID